MSIRASYPARQNNLSPRILKNSEGKVTVKFQEPKFETVELGQVPRNYKVDNSEGNTGLFQFAKGHKSPDMHPGMLRAVNKEQPVVDDGQIQFQEAEKTFEVGPVDPKWPTIGSTLLGGHIGMVVGGAVGALAVAASLPAVIGGAVVGAAVVGGAMGIASFKNNSEKVRELAWVETPIMKHELLGFRVRETKNEPYSHRDPSNISGFDGISGSRGTYYERTTTPWIDSKQVGSYMKPVVIFEGETPPKPENEDRAWQELLGITH